MTAAQQALVYLAAVVLPLLLAGLIVRRLFRVCSVFTVYIAAVSLSEILIFSWPQRFYTWEFWIFKETLFGVLKFGTAIELVGFTFQAFPGARVVARRTLLVGLSLILGALLAAPGSGADTAAIAQELQPRLANGTALLFAAVWALVLWYNLPVHPFHRAILRGFVPYLLVFTVGVRLVGTLGWDVRKEASFADGLAYDLVLIYWTWVAWRPSAPPGSDDIVRTLQPWRDRL